VKEDQLSPYRAPVDADGDFPQGEVHTGWLWLFFSFQGRIGRGSYWLGNILLIFSFAVVLAVLQAAFGLRQFSMELGALAPREAWIYMAAVVPFSWGWFALATKRWHDRNKSAAWTFIHAVPYIGGAWVFVECGLMAGTRGENRFGSRAYSPWGR